MSDAPVPESLSGVQLHRIDCLDDAFKLKRWLGERRPILAVDTETTGLQTWKDQVRLIQFGDAYQGWTVPWETGRTELGGWAGLAREVLREYEGELVFHNAKYDVAIMKQSCGIDLAWHKVHDTALMSRIIDPTQPRALKVLGTMYIDPKAGLADAALDKAMADNKWTWATIPLEAPVYSVYAAMDTVLTARAYALFYPQVQSTCPLAYDLERAFQFCAMKMEMRGMRVDVPYTQAALDSFETYVRQVTDWCLANYNVAPSQDVKVIERLRQDGVEFTKMTASGSRYALDREVLEEIALASSHPLASAVAARRRIDYLISHYLRNFISMQEGGLLHPGMDTMGAVTARTTVDKPAMQTLPRRAESNPAAITVRNCIVPSEGNVLMLTDFDQIEMRTLAHLAGDTGLMAAFGEGDFFVNVARELYQDSTLERKDERRQHTKNGMYALSYGAGAEKIALTTGASLEAVHQFLNSLAVRFPGIKRLQRKVQTTAEDRMRIEGRPYVRSPLTGRHYHLARNDKIYALVNYLIQGTAGEILKMKTVELDLAGVGDYITMLVHDEVIMDVPVADVQDVARVTSSVMNDAALLGVPITAQVELGDRWGDKGSLQLEEVAHRAAAT